VAQGVGPEFNSSTIKKKLSKWKAEYDKGNYQALHKSGKQMVYKLTQKRLILSPVLEIKMEIIMKFLFMFIWSKKTKVEIWNIHQDMNQIVTSTL
jgi:hypothetical protein